MDNDYYAILGVHPSAEEAVISAAYRALAKLYHPDLYKGDDAAERMAKINEAYATLSDEDKRKEYDANRTNSLPEDDPEFYATDYRDEGVFGEDWSLAVEYHPEIAKEAEDLEKISPKLAFAYKAFLIETKKFKDYSRIATKFRNDFLTSYFGTNKKILALAKALIRDERKDILLGLNRAVRVLGRSAEPAKVIEKIEKKYKFKFHYDNGTIKKDEYSNNIVLIRIIIISASAFLILLLWAVISTLLN